MTIDNEIRDEKLQYDINREVAITPALSSGKIDKYKYLTGEEILRSNQKQIIEQAKFTFFGKSFRTPPSHPPPHPPPPTPRKKNNWRSRTKINWCFSDKQLPSIKEFISKEELNPKIIDEEKRKLIEAKWFTNDIIKPMILENLKQYVFLVMKLEIVLLIWTSKMINKTI